MVRLLIAATILLSGTLAAAACGNGLLLALLFRAYPEAKLVVSADRNARREGRLPGEAWSTRADLTLHEWRALKTAATIRQLRKNAAESGASVAAGESAHLFLIHEFRWIELRREGGGMSIALRKHGPEGDEVRLFTTRRVLDNLLDRTFSLQEAIDSEFIAWRGDEGRSAAWLAALAELTGQGKERSASLQPSQAAP